MICKNQWLASLPNDVFDMVGKHLKTFRLAPGEVLWEIGDEMRQVYFPESGIVSLAVELSDGDAVRTAMLGRRNVLNALSALDAETALTKGIVQVAGSALVADVGPIRKIALESREFRVRLVRHEQMLLAHTQHTAACNARHSIEARTCRWLLRMGDLAESNQIGLTHEQLAHVLGVRRSGVSIAAEALREAGLIRYQRGLVHLTDIKGLRRLACECYETVKSMWGSPAIVAVILFGASAHTVMCGMLPS